MKPVTIAVGYVHPEQVSAFWHGSLITLLQKEWQRVVKVIAILSGPKIDSARNDLFKQWLLTTTADYFFMTDTDMVLPPDTINRLLEADKDIIGGLCFVGHPPQTPVRPTLHVIKPDDKGNVFIDILWDYPRDTLVRVDATGGACMLIRRDVAEKIWVFRGEDHPMPWFAHGMHNKVEIGEDIAFCLTAGKCGFEVWVDTGLIIPHVKPHFLSDNDYDHPEDNHGGSIDQD